MDRCIGEWCSYNDAAWSFYINKSCSRLLSTEVKLYCQKQQNRVFFHPLGDLGVTYTVYLWLFRKRVVDFPPVPIERFSPALTVEALWTDIGRNCGVRKVVSGSLWTKISAVSGSLPPTTLSGRKLESLGNRVVLFAWSYVCRYDTITRMCETDTHIRQTDRETDRQTHRHTMTANTRPSLAPRLLISKFFHWQIPRKLCK